MNARIEWKWSRDNRRMILVLACRDAILNGCPLSISGNMAEAVISVAQINDRRRQLGLAAIEVI